MIIHKNDLLKNLLILQPTEMGHTLNIVKLELNANIIKGFVKKHEVAKS